MASNMSHDPQMAEEKRLKALKLSRRGKKSSITRRVAELERLVSEGGSRTRIQFLMEAMLKVYQEITEVCLQISILAQDIDEKNDLELVKEKIDSCIAQVTDYLDSRRDDPPSTNSLCSTWIAEHTAMMENVSKGSRSSTDVASMIPEDVISIREPSISEEPFSRTNTVAGGVFASAESRSADLDRNGKITGKGGCD